MIDELEVLLEAVAEEESQGMSLVISSTPLPRGDGIAAETPVFERAEIDTVLAEVAEEILLYSARGTQGNDNLPREQKDSTETAAEPAKSLMEQMIIADRRGTVAEGMWRTDGGRQGGDGGDRSVMADATSFGVASGERRQSGSTVDVARTVDRAVQRDARRYDGGFFLG